MSLSGNVDTSPHYSALHYSVLHYFALHYSAFWFYSAITGIALFTASLQAEERELSYDGNIRARAFYLQRDILLPASAELREANRPAAGSAEETFCNNSPQICETSSQSEDQEYFDLRLRLNFKLRASALVDVIYALEIGDLVLGREENPYGPGSGGQGSGRTNVETRELYFDIHNDYQSFQDRLLLRFGIFSFSTPEGIVMARSGGGLRAVWERSRLRSLFELLYFRQIDNSWVDGDSNGFSDDNFADIHLALLSWHFHLSRAVNLKLYSLYRQDSSAEEDDPGEEQPEISQLYWGGLYWELVYGRFHLILHGIGNWGHFLRSSGENSLLADLAPEDPLRPFLEERIEPQLNQRYDVQAGAGKIELRFRTTRKLSFSLLYAQASGQLPGAAEGDKDSSASAQLRRDQFRTAGSSFQLSEIAVDSSGGFAIRPGGQLTGLAIGGLTCSLQGLSALPKLELTAAYFHIENYRPPKELPKYLGREWNLKAAYSFDARFQIMFHLSRFNSGVAYRTLYNTDGRQVYEAKLSLEQKF